LEWWVGMKTKICSFILSVATLIIVGCSSGSETIQMEGYLLEVEAGRVLLVENITFYEFNKIKELSVRELVELEKASMAPSLIYLSYGKTEDYKKGDKVIATIIGDIAMSFQQKQKQKK
jgi:hypothetical protein